MPKFILKITQESKEDYISDNNLECFCFSSSLSDAYLQQQVLKAQSADKIVLFEGDEAEEKVKKFAADGLIVDLSKVTAIKKEMRRIKESLPKSFLGVICRNRRHEAMIVSENEPDFIVFKIWEEGKENTLELLRWYNEFFLLQMAVEPMDKNMEISDCPADIIILSPEDYKILVAKKQTLE